MGILDKIKNELYGFTFFEKIFYISALLTAITASILANDDKIALINAICGMSYTFFAGKGKVYCYYLGIIGSLCYCYIAYKNGFFGNLFLYGLFYVPMGFIGLINWGKNLKKGKNEIIKTRLTNKERIFYFSLAFISSLIFGFILSFIENQKLPYLDISTTVFSILGQILTVKRCYEQWWVWIFVNIVSLIMWIFAFIEGSNCLSTVIMWAVYVFFAFYFRYKWKKELEN